MTSAADTAPPSAPPEDALAALRSEIDHLDDQLHDLVMRRADVVATLAASRVKGGASPLRPGREAMILRRLLARHQGALPGGAVVRLWREIFGASSAMQGGFAVESSYKFLNDQLEVGLDFGAASGDDAPGMGLRPVINQKPKAGDLDGRQYGECLDALDDGQGVEGAAVDGVNCAVVDNDVTNFRFDPDYNVDMILFREILGTVNDALYVKPHIGYYFTPDLGVRADVIYSQAVFASSTPGQQNPLGLEIDTKAFYATEDGFHLMPQLGFFLPFGGLNHFDPDLLSNKKFATAQFAWTFQLFAGVSF